MSEEQTPLEPGVLPGVTKPTITKIRKTNIVTVESLAAQTPPQLAADAGIGQDTASSAITKARTYLHSGFITGDQLLDKLSTRTRLTTGSKAVDKILGGGIESETTTEVAGPNGVGKTQLMHMLAITAQRPAEQGGLDGRVAWIDTEGTFRPERILEICRLRELDGGATLRGIYHGLARSTDEQKKLIKQLYSLCPENNIKLIIVDSMIGHLRGEYLGRGTLSARQNELGGMLQTLMKVAMSTKTTVIYTNQIISDPGKMFGNPDKPTGGNIMGHAATTRVQIRRSRQDKRVLTLTKSAYLPAAEALFRITPAGIEDVEKHSEDP